MKKLWVSVQIVLLKKTLRNRLQRTQQTKPNNQLLIVEFNRHTFKKNKPQQKHLYVLRLTTRKNQKAVQESQMEKWGRKINR
jgi:hypothetical protein